MRKFICVKNNSVICLKDIPIPDLEEKLNNIYDVVDTAAIDNICPLKTLMKANKVLDEYCNDEYYYDLINYNIVDIIHVDGDVISITTK